MACLDTSFIIDFLNKGSGRETLEELENRDEEINVPSPVITELIKGIGSKHASKSEEKKINEFIDSLTALTLDRESAKTAGEIEVDLSKRGEKIGLTDVLIASIAIKNNEKLITKNEKHFSKINGLEVKPI
ncbi:MAG: PIN domain-containing protein [Candidatus Pacearchaeota archaeon]